MPSMPNSLRRSATNARPTSPCSSSVIPSAMSTVSFASMLRCGAFSGDGFPEPLLEPSADATAVVAALLRLRRRRAERLVPLPVPAGEAPEPFGPASPSLAPGGVIAAVIVAAAGPPADR